MSFAAHQIEILRRLISGSSWYAACTLVQQCFGFLITLFVARTLSPKAVGLIAIAWLTINAFDVFSRSGAGDALIHTKDDPDSYLTTYFWIELIRGAGLTTLGVLTASTIAGFFGEPAASSLIVGISFIPLARALRSPSLLLYQRELHFRDWGKLMSLSYTLSFIISLSALAIWKTPQAYVIALIIGELITSLLSHTKFPFLPKFQFNLKSAKFLLNYGRWLLGAGILSYLAIYLDRYVIGTLGDAAMLGIYAVASQIGESFTYRISKALSGALQPAYARLQTGEGANQLFQLVFKLSLAIFSLIALVVWFWLPCVVPLILGESWTTAIPIFSIFVLSGLLRSLSAASSPYLKGVGLPQLIFRIETLRAVAIALSMIPAFIYGGLLGASLAIAFTAAGQLLCTLFFLKKEACIDQRYLLGLLPLLLLTIATTLLLATIRNYLGANTYILALEFSGILCAYAATILFIERDWISKARHLL